MDINYKISVVVPVYNGVKYLCECLDSIVGQTFRDFEIVLINDGSKDKSIDICNEYASRHDNIHVFSQDNQGINQTKCSDTILQKFYKWLVILLQMVCHDVTGCLSRCYRGFVRGLLKLHGAFCNLQRGGKELTV